MIFAEERNSKFKGAFGVDIDYFADPLVKMGYRTWSFDIIKFDDYCRKELGYNEEKDGSLRDFILGRFGEDILQSVISLFEAF